MAAKKSKNKSKNTSKNTSFAKKAKPNKKLGSKSVKPAAIAKSRGAAPKKATAPAKQKSLLSKVNQSHGSSGGGLQPSRDGVLVERVQELDRTAGGLYIPASATEKPSKGRVVSAGRGKLSKAGRLRPLDVQPGDEVLFGKFAGTEIKIDGKEYLLIREDEILGVVS